VNDAPPIGVFDSGAGGLSIVGAIRQALPGRDIAYFADTAFAPYGPRSDAQILERTHACCTKLLAQGVGSLVIACNTATANAIDELRTWSPVPVVGVEPGLKPGAAATRSGVVGVLATRATLASRRYRKLLEKIGAQWPKVRFVEHWARGWVEFVEAGELDSDRARAQVRAAVEPLTASGADTLVLGCTHYPFLRPLIEEAAPGATIVETGPAVARELHRRLGSPAPDAAESRPSTLYLESSADAARFLALAGALLGTGAGVIATRSGARPLEALSQGETP
jgi:glutamate racemase